MPGSMWRKWLGKEQRPGGGASMAIGKRAGGVGSMMRGMARAGQRRLLLGVEKVVEGVMDYDGKVGRRHGGMETWVLTRGNGGEEDGGGRGEGGR